MSAFITRRHLSRRTLLRGVGTALALPLLESMMPAMSAVPTPRVAFWCHLLSAWRHHVALDARG